MPTRLDPQERHVTGCCSSCASVCSSSWFLFSSFGGLSMFVFFLFMTSFLFLLVCVFSLVYGLVYFFCCCLVMDAPFILGSLIHLISFFLPLSLLSIPRHPHPPASPSCPPSYPFYPPFSSAYLTLSPFTVVSLPLLHPLILSIPSSLPQPYPLPRILRKT